MTASFDFLGMELAVECGSCGATTPINGPERQATCGSCFAPLVVDDAAWGTALEGCDQDFGTLGRGVMVQGRLEGAGRDVRWERGPDRPVCLGCGGAVEVAPDQSRVTCARCGPRAVLPAPEWLKARADAVTGYLAEGPEEQRGAGTAAGITCSGCGASLSPDGSSRMADCPYCGTSSLLPEDVWRALHPPKRGRRFWLRVRIDPDPRREQPDLGAELLRDAYGSIASVAGGAFSLGWIPAVATCLVMGDGAGGSMSTWSFIFAYAVGGLALSVPIGALLFASALHRYFTRRQVVSAEHEVVGVLGPLVGRKAQVQVCHPTATKDVLATTTMVLSEDEHRNLGGDGALVRAWHRRGGRRVHARPLPTALV